MTSLVCALSLLSSLSWIVMRDGDRITMNGDTRDIEAARSFTKKYGPEFLWFRQDGKQYVVKDARVVEEIDQAIRPQEELGHDQARLGARQADLGRQQAALGRRQAQLGVEMARSGMNGERPDRAVDEEMQELSRAQEALGREQEKIGHEQEKMGRKQERLSKQVEEKVRSLIETALADGSAKPVD